MLDGGAARAARAISRVRHADVDLLADCGLDERRVDALAAEAERCGTCAHEVALAAGEVCEAQLYLALARRTGLSFASGEHVSFATASPLPWSGELRLGLRVLPAWFAGGAVAVLAPKGEEVGRLLRADLRGRRSRLLLMCPGEALAGLVRDRGTEIASAACGLLAARRPDLSAASTPRRALKALALCVAGLSLLVAAELFAPGAGLVAAGLAATVLFGLGVWVRAEALLAAEVRAHPPLPDAALPRVTILAPLYREAHLVPDLLAALGALDYPAAKREIFILVEEDDAPTRAALDGARGVCVLVTPKGRLRGKPRALQFALPFATGDLVTVYDAEDAPDPGQLRAAAAAFAAGSDRLACVQSPLAIRPGRSWIERQFALEYAGLFLKLVPGLARRGFPVLLGGTSNHFRAGVLRGAGGWDPYNVTEDADLGVRLARLGYTVDVIAPATAEEAPDTLASWLGQRRRWFKGWLQTAMVHFGRPRRLVRELGLRRALALTGLLLGTLCAAFVQPLGLVSVGLALLAAPSFGPVAALFTGLMLAGYVAGHAVAIAVLASGARAAGLEPTTRDLAGAWLVYWLLGAVAAWSALFALAARPFYWVKTEHRGRRGAG
jgi:cellulose synthase/poly-beta-1,6-N-acetylglucosamine synthase-like glycosyltransferase